MGTSVTRTKTATWLVAPPDSDADVGAVLAGSLEGIGAGRGPALVRELVNRTVEAARRADATGDDLAAALVTAVLDALDVASRAPLEARTAKDTLRSHLEEGAAASAVPEVAAAWLPRIVGAVEGLVEQCGDDAENTAFLTATMMLVDVGGGLEQRFGCLGNGDALLSALQAASSDLTTCESLSGVRALVGANAAFEKGVDLNEYGDPGAAMAELGRARSLFLEAGLRVEAAVTLTEQAYVESEGLDDPDLALGHWSDARAVLVEYGREIEVARADRDIAFAYSRRNGPGPAGERVEAAATVFERHDLVRDLVLCDVVLACLARQDNRVRTAEGFLRSAAGRLHDLGLEGRAAQLRSLAERGGLDLAPE